MNVYLHLIPVTVLSFIFLTCLYEGTLGMSVKFVPELKRAESNYKWFKISKGDKESEEIMPAGFHTNLEETQPQIGNEHIPLPLALKMLQEKRGLFDLGTGRGYSGFQAMRGNLGLAFASPGSHGK